MDRGPGSPRGPEAAPRLRPAACATLLLAAGLVSAGAAAGDAARLWPLRGQQERLWPLRGQQERLWPLRGQVLLAPTCPGPDLEAPGCHAPFAGAALIVQSEDGRRVVARQVTDVEGRFRLQVPAGRYRVLVDAGKVTRCTPLEVTLPRADDRALVIDCDSGRR